ncbi:hypothetical protein OM076_17135 [Solirubrobacter ginsenosidimutans]|uniref:CARDB domain-containing protein n=1 Tax=Solirubrobacter ginsenosidimutans TaxID=490573 RepID=A0A9X3S283_9ACTN|nr:hypothetical protein [Solirubrobacter ginsenosidimutans]MDA0162002.1 hypothetical protein [Solirubrobacter ginsenosidimutans]
MDAQTVLVRRMIAGIAGVVLLLILFFLVRACNNTRHENALKDYTRQVSAIGTESQQQGEQLFKALGAAGQGSPTDLYQSILALKGSADQSLKQAQALSVPGDMSPAQQSLLITLELRRDALQATSDNIKDALGDPGDNADAAINHIAGQINAMNASDVLYQTRVQPLMKSAMAGAGLPYTILPSQFVREISWVSPAYVAQKLGTQLSAGTDANGTDTTKKNQTTGPGLHGTGLNSTVYGNVTLQPGVSNRLTYVKGQAFVVTFTNQGDNDEFDVKVTLKIANASGSGTPITLTKTVPQITKGQKLPVELPLNREPALGAAVNVSVTVAAVPGEKKTDNNKSTYPTLFAQG